MLDLMRAGIANSSSLENTDGQAGFFGQAWGSFSLHRTHLPTGEVELVLRYQSLSSRSNTSYSALGKVQCSETAQDKTIILKHQSTSVVLISYTAAIGWHRPRPRIICR